MAKTNRRYCELHHENPPTNSRGQCLICLPEEISTGHRYDTTNLQDPPREYWRLDSLFWTLISLISVTWPSFLRRAHRGEDQAALTPDPPTYMESAADENNFDTAMAGLPREELSNMLREYLAEYMQYNPWGSQANLVPSRS